MISTSIVLLTILSSIYLILMLYIIINEVRCRLDFGKPKIIRSQVSSYNNEDREQHRTRYRTRDEFVALANAYSVFLERTSSNPSEDLGLLSVNESSVINSVIIPNSEVLNPNTEENKKEDVLPLKKIDYIVDRLKSIEESVGD